MSELRQNTAPAPWYRHRWPWLLMAGPAIVVVAGFMTAWIAIKTNDGLVEDNYYKVGLAVNQELNQKKLAMELGLKADLFFSDSGNYIRVVITGLQPAALPETLQLKLVHPTRKGEDQVVILRREAKQYIGQLAATPSIGRWHVVLEDPFAGWRMDTVWDLKTDPHVSFSAKHQ